MDPQVPEKADRQLANLPSRSLQATAQAKAKGKLQGKRPAVIANPTVPAPSAPAPTKRAAPSASSAPAAKRPRQELTKHARHWVEDGSIVVQLGTTEYKLQRSRLVAQSAYFADPASVGPDVTLVVLKMDLDCRDFDALLDAMDNGITYHHNPPAFPVLAAILRAATALQCAQFTAWAARCIRDMWPSALTAVTNNSIPHAAAALRLANMCDEVWGARKRALYELLRKPCFGHGRITSKDTLTLVRAREGVTRTWNEALAAACTGSCARPGKCYRGGVPLAAARLAQEYPHDIVRGLRELVCLEAKSPRCSACRAQRVADEEQRLIDVWADLDKWFAEYE